MTVTKQAGKKKKPKAAALKSKKSKSRKTPAGKKAAVGHDGTIDTSGWGFPVPEGFDANDDYQPDATKQDVIEASTADDESTLTVGGMVERIKRGELSLIPRLRQFLQTQPDLWHRHGNVAELAIIAWVKIITGAQNPIEYQSFILRADEVRKQFSGDSPSPAEQALAESIATCWLRLHVMNATEGSASKSVTDPQTMAVILKQQQQAFRQFNEAVMQLEILRRLVPRVV